MLLALSLAVLSCAREEQIHFDIDSGDASQTLKTFAVQADLDILFDERDLSGLQTSAVVGRMSKQAALQKMIAGTGLVFHHDKESQAIAVSLPPDL